MVWVPGGTNCITGKEDKLRDMLCATTQFQDWVGVPGSSQAKAYCFAHEVPPDGAILKTDDDEEFDLGFWQSLRNFALIYTAREDGFTYRYAASTNDFLERGTIVVEFERYFLEPPSNRLDEYTRTALNEIGGIIEAVFPLVNTETYLSLNEWRIMELQWPDENEETDQGWQFRVVTEVDWTMGEDEGAA